MTKKEADERIEILEGALIATLWMARRYADGRSTYTTFVVNSTLDQLKKIGLEIREDPTLPDHNYARDGMFGTWNSEKGGFEK